MALERPTSTIVWDLRKLWAKALPVVITLEHPPAMLPTIIGPIRRIAVTGAFVVVDGWHIPTDYILRADRATIEQLDAYKQTAAERAYDAGEDHA